MNLVLSSPRTIPWEPGRNGILARLLCDAVESLECDTERARVSLFRAVALVQQTPTSAPDARGLAPWQAQKTIDLIDEHLAGRTGITELAANVRLSHSHFHRAFKEFFGRSPKQFILQRRIERALGLMLATIVDFLILRWIAALLIKRTSRACSANLSVSLRMPGAELG